MIKLTSVLTPLHTISHPIEVVNFLVYSPVSPMSGYVELVAKTLDGRELVQGYDRLYQLQTDKNYLVEYRLPLGVIAATVSGRWRIPYQPNHTGELWVLPTVVNSDTVTTSARLEALALAVGEAQSGIEDMEVNMARRSTASTEQRIDVGASNVQLVGADATGLRLSVVIVHAGDSGLVYLRTGPDAATATAWIAQLEPGDLIELETGEAVQALASSGTIPVNVTEVS
jgi:hypothetical protein